MNLSSEERDCTESCRSVEHGDHICATLTKRCVSETDLCAYINSICCCCESVRDCCGRVALHVAASCGKAEVIKWLVQYRHVNINAKDVESNYTALHRSLFYGKIHVAVCLMKLGANLSLLDSDGLTPLEHALKDQKHPIIAKEGEIYVWGSNTNYTLGPQQARSVPEIMDIFSKEHPNVEVKQVCLSKFHCVIVGSDGRVYSCGHGHGGRLGLTTEHSVLSPKVVRFAASGHLNTVACVQASIAQDHSVFLMDTGHIWTCGLNTHRVLGITPPPPQVVIPRPLTLLPHPIVGICAVKYHTIAWGDREIYSWGLHSGQLGHAANGQKYIITPKKIPSLISNEAKIVAVASGIGASTFCTSKGDIYLLHEYQCRKIATKHTNVIALSIIGGKLDASVDNTLVNDSHQLEVCALTDVGNLLVWQESDPQLSRCIFSLNRVIKVRQVVLNTNGMLLSTTEGEVFEGKVKERKKKALENAQNTQKSAFHKFLEKDDCRMVKVNKISRIHRAIWIDSDLKAGNFAVIQVNPRFNLTNIPEIPPSTFKDDISKFLQEADELDQITDIIYKVKHKFFAAHRYIIAFHSDKLSNRILPEGDNIMEINDVEPEIFEQLLFFIYTGDCDLLKPGKVTKTLERFLKNEPLKKEQTKAKDPVRMLQDIAKRYGVTVLHKLLENFSFHGDIIKRKNDKPLLRQVPKFDRNSYQEYYDVRIKTKNGKELMAHKCVLVARMEYFGNLFSVRWAQTTSMHEISLPYPYTVVEHLLEYLYTDELTMETEDVDHICSLLILADEFFITRLKGYCEYILSTVISLKNITQMLTFSNAYGAKQLSNCCMEFVCLNLAALLESRCLELVDENILNEITEYYFTWNPIMQQRVITPFSTAPSDEDVLNCRSRFPSLNHEIEKENKPIAKSASKRKSRTHKNSLSSKAPEMEVDVKNESVPEVESTVLVEVQVASPPIRIQAINSAFKQVQNETVLTDFVKLSLSGDEDFPVLGSPPNHSFSKSTKVESKAIDFKGKVTKLSQKQRKRLSSESNANDVPVCLPQESPPKNPWKICTDPPLPMTPHSCKDRMDAIITAEKKQKENFTKMLSKPLLYTQKEDKAIEDLHKFYNSENVFDEIILIERVQMALAKPVWVQKNK